MAALATSAFAGKALAHGAAARPAARAASVISAAAAEGEPIASPPKSLSGKEYMMSLPGILAPTGFFDPAGFTDADNFTVAEAKRFREAEVTHGRVAMLASVGWIVQEEFHPLFGGNISGPAFSHFQAVEAEFGQFWEVILLAIGICEAYRITLGWENSVGAGLGSLKDDYSPGDLAFDPLGLAKDLPADELYALKTKELNNGRLAMFAIAGFAAQEGVDRVTIWRGLVDEDIINPRTLEELAPLNLQ